MCSNRLAGNRDQSGGQLDVKLAPTYILKKCCDRTNQYAEIIHAIYALSENEETFLKNKTNL